MRGPLRSWEQGGRRAARSRRRRRAARRPRCRPGRRAPRRWRRTIERPRPKPSSSERTPLRPNRSNTRSRCSGSMPGPRSRTQSRTPSCPWAEPIAISSPASVCLTALSASWSTACVTRCPSRTTVPCAVASSTHSRSPSPRALATRSSVSSGEVDRGRTHEVGPVALGEQDQVADQAGHPVDLVEQQLLGLGHLRGRAGVEELEVAAHHRERRAQLVAGVVEELPLADERLLEPVEHAVDGAGEGGDVVVAGDREPLREVALADVARRSRAACAAAPAAGRTASAAIAVTSSSDRKATIA